MEAQPDFRELLALLNSHGVEYVIVGAHALAFHGAPRYTDDMDIYLRADRENARRVMSAPLEFGFGSMGLSDEDFSASGRVVQLGCPPVRIDLLTGLSGVSWDEVAAGSVRGEYGGEQPGTWAVRSS
ncbi:MAG: hypothetical protein MUE60_13825 [Candidatus Eisenbacteria bacterium]|jgi:hypothetical protein|nr:hypothetical protein [Candidatus Eisenbacteria bacterium]